MCVIDIQTHELTHWALSSSLTEQLTHWALSSSLTELLTQWAACRHIVHSLTGGLSKIPRFQMLKHHMMPKHHMLHVWGGFVLLCREKKRVHVLTFYVAPYVFFPYTVKQNHPRTSIIWCLGIIWCLSIWNRGILDKPTWVSELCACMLLTEWAARWVSCSVLSEWVQYIKNF